MAKLRGKPFVKGQKRLPRAGRKPGSKNKATLQRSDILAMVLGALQTAGGQKAFEVWAKGKAKKGFLKEVIGLIPKEDKLNVNGIPSLNIIIEHTGKPGGKT